MLPGKSILIFLLIVLCGFKEQVNKPQISRWVVLKGGALRVDGSTNVNKFNCVIANYAKPDTLLIYKQQSKEALPMNGSLLLDVESFDCHLPVMTNDLRKTLKAKQFPKLYIRFLNLHRYPDFNLRQEFIKGIVAIELAGVTKRYEVDYKFLSSGDKIIHLVGTRQINFSDFNIVPPRKIGGMIQTNNELSVEFTLRMKVLD